VKLNIIFSNVENFFLFYCTIKAFKKRRSTFQDDWEQHYIMPLCGKHSAQFCVCSFTDEVDLLGWDYPFSGHPATDGLGRQDLPGCHMHGALWCYVTLPGCFEALWCYVTLPGCHGAFWCYVTLPGCHGAFSCYVTLQGLSWSPLVLRRRPARALFRKSYNQCA
jgi:hypothetical protein